LESSLATEDDEEEDEDEDDEDDEGKSAANALSSAVVPRAGVAGPTTSFASLSFRCN
jgi:hypothetical protein